MIHLSFVPLSIRDSSKKLSIQMHSFSVTFAHQRRFVRGNANTIWTILPLCKDLVHSAHTGLGLAGFYGRLLSRCLYSFYSDLRLRLGA